jgi:hypothetical protein
VTIDHVYTEVVSSLIEGLDCRWFGQSSFLWKNIIMGHVTYDALPDFFCNDIVAEFHPPFDPGPENFNLDPRFCGVQGSGNYYLRSDSPCAPGNQPNGLGICGLIGPLPVGCGTVAAEERTWGSIKSMYR